jgi:hypothetical protein
MIPSEPDADNADEGMKTELTLSKANPLFLKN